jgi:FtsZ-binding cell division protein ZapB
MKNFAAVVQPFTKLFLTLLLTLCAAGLYAQLGTLSVQGVLTKADGTAVDDGSYTLKFRLWKDPNSTDNSLKVHEEDLTVETTGGVYSTILGLNTPFGPSATFADVYYLGVTFGSSELLPRPRLTAAPYAMGLLGGSNIIAGAGNITVDGVLSDSYAFKSSGNSGMFWSGETSFKHAGNTRLLIGSNGSNYFTGATFFDGRAYSNDGFGYRSGGTGYGTGLFFDGSQNKASIYTDGNVRFHAWDDGKNYYRATNGHFFDVGNVQVSGNVNANAFRARGGAPGAGGGSNNGYAFEGSNGDNDSGLFGYTDGQVSLYANNSEVVYVSNSNVVIGPQLTVGGQLFLNSVQNNIDGHNLEWSAFDPSGKGTKDGRVSINTSSRRFKYNIKPLDEDFSQILHLQPRRYTRTLDPSGPSEIGYIAEEVDSLGMKCLTLYEDEDKKIPLSINYKKMVMFTNEIVKMHHTEIEKMKAEIAALTAEKNAFRTENDTLRAANSALQTNQAEFSTQLNALSKRLQAIEAVTGNR